MTGLGAELSGLMRPLDDVLSIRGVNDRVDALTLYCRGLLRGSSLCLIDGGIHYFDGRSYVPVSNVRDILGNLLTDSGVSPTDVRRMGDMPLSVIGERSFSRDAGVIAFENGVLRLGESGEEFICGFDRGLVVSETLPYLYVRDAACPMWDSFLSEVLPDREERDVLQMFFGSCYVDRARMSVEKFAIFLGSGANGKSVLREVVSRAMGKDNVTAYDAQQLTRSELVPFLSGKRINFASDMKASAAFDSALKALASGQDVVGRKIYGEPVTVQAPPLAFSMNELPPFRDTSPAFFRRVLLFSFDVVIPEEKRDSSLAEKICRRELPGVFQWIMRGRRKLLASGGHFPSCEKMERNISLVRRDVSSGADYPVRAYLESRGLSVYPSFKGQPAILVSQNEIRLGLHSTISPTAITRELNAFGVKTFRSKELKYKVYEKK